MIHLPPPDKLREARETIKVAADYTTIAELCVGFWSFSEFGLMFGVLIAVVVLHGHGRQLRVIGVHLWTLTRHAHRPLIDRLAARYRR